MKLPKRTCDTRVKITKLVFGEYASRYHLKAGTVLDGSIGEDGNFRTGDVDGNDTVIYPGYFKVLGKFYFRKAKS